MVPETEPVFEVPVEPVEPVEEPVGRWNEFKAMTWSAFSGISSGADQIAIKLAKAHLDANNLFDMPGCISRVHSIEFQKMIDKALRSMGNNQAQKEHLVLFLGYIEVPGHRRTFEKNKITDDKLGKPFAFKGIMHGLQGYYVTPGAAQTLLDYAFPIEMQVDSYIGILADVLDDFNKLTLVAFKKSLVNQANINDSNIQSKCTLCNGHVNANRFHTKSLMEKREICRRMGGCPMDFSSAAPSVKSSSSSVVGFVLTALAATSLLFLNKKK
jgi:hypothetical protein